MKITKAQLKLISIHNPHNMARIAGSKLYIGYLPAEAGRAAHYSAWTIIGIGFDTNKGGAWYDYGQKNFPFACREEKESELQKAKQWVKDTYGITEWERDVFGSYQIKGTLAKIQELLKNKQ